MANGIFERTSVDDHNHASNHHVRAAYLTAFEQARNMVRDNINRSVISIHKEVLDTLPIEVAGFFNWENCREMLQRIRNRTFPPCRNLEDFEALLADEEGPVFEQFGRLHGEKCYMGTANGHLMFVNMQLLHSLAGFVFRWDVWCHSVQNTTIACGHGGASRSSSRYLLRHHEIASHSRL